MSSLLNICDLKIFKLSLASLQYAFTTPQPLPLLGVVFRDVQFAAHRFENKRSVPVFGDTVGIMPVDILHGIKIRIIGHLFQEGGCLDGSASYVVESAFGVLTAFANQRSPLLWNQLR